MHIVDIGYFWSDVNRRSLFKMRIREWRKSTEEWGFPMSVLYRKIKEYLEQHHQRHLLRRVAAALACLVVFITKYALIYPAITLEKHAACGYEEHAHSDACYENVLVC